VDEKSSDGEKEEHGKNGYKWNMRNFFGLPPVIKDKEFLFFHQPHESYVNIS